MCCTWPQAVQDPVGLGGLWLLLRHHWVMRLAHVEYLDPSWSLRSICCIWSQAVQDPVGLGGLWLFFEALAPFEASLGYAACPYGAFNTGLFLFTDSFCRPFGPPSCEVRATHMRQLVDEDLLSGRVKDLACEWLPSGK